MGICLQIECFHYFAHSCMYREDFNRDDKFMALRFMVNGALCAAGCMRVLPMTQHV
jgi:hypothetical protein